MKPLYLRPLPDETVIDLFDQAVLSSPTKHYREVLPALAELLRMEWNESLLRSQLRRKDRQPDADSGALV